MMPRCKNDGNDFNDSGFKSCVAISLAKLEVARRREMTRVSVRRKIERSFDDEAMMKKQQRMKNDVNEEEVR